MSTITLPNIRVGSDLQVRVRLKDGGVAIDWSTLSNIKACIYSDAQRALAGRCAFSIDEEDNTLLVCTYAANKPQYLGVNRIVISAKYMGETKTYDKPAFSFVRWTADQEGEEITIDDPDVDVEIEVEDVSSSLLDQAIAAALQAAADAEHAAHLIPNQVLLDCEQATADANAAAEAANAAGITSVQVSVEDNEPGTPSADVSLVNKVLSIIFHYLKGNTGEAAGFGAITATVDDVVGDPSVTVTASGPDTAKVLAFAFHGLRGIQGVPGVANAKYKQVDTLPTASAATMDFIYLTPSGTTGVYNMSYTEQDGSTYSWQDLGTTAIQLSDYATKAEVSQLEAKVDDFEDAVLEQIEDYKPIVIEGNVTNAPDEEDITTDENDLLKFADRSALYGKGYTILRRDKTFAEQVVLLNTIYEIRYNFDLNGGTVNIPSGCTLRFNGGAVSNGSIVYNNTEIQGEPIISCTCTGSLRNTVVTPQMYGAKGDGITDDNVALNNAAKYNDCVFFPAGKYITTQPISMHSGLTLFGVGEESKIENPTYNGYNKVCINTGALTVGNNTGSFLELTAYSCTISSDRYSVLVSDTSPFNVGDLVYICKDESYTTKNPTYFWVGKVVDITENTSIKLDYYIGNDSLVGVNCLVRDLATLPTNTDKITENICVHDLNLSNSNDDGSGMYVLELASYGAKIYNIWAHGNTIVGANFLVNATIRNLTAEFDGGFLDIPEVSQNVEVSDCRAKRFGARQNIIGMSFLAGYGALVRNNNIDFGGSGKVGFGEHIKATIKNNVFLNLFVNSGRPVELSKFGNTIFEGNTVSSPTDTSIINPGDGAEGHIIKDNYIDNPNTVRWIEGYLSFKFNKNCVKGNLLTHQNEGDSYYNAFPDTRIATDIPAYGWPGTVNMAANRTETAMESTIKLTNSRIVRLSFMAQLGSYTITLTGQNGSTTAIPLTNGTWIDIFILGASNYVNVRRDGDLAGAARYPFNSHGYVKKIDLTNNTAETRQIYYMCIKPEVD